MRMKEVAGWNVDELLDVELRQVSGGGPARCCNETGMDTDTGHLSQRAASHQQKFRTQIMITSTLGFINLK